ncbi:MAG: site-specific integrase, partial [Firmicutes bacterium]|nr:site-specific integrase [Bacillota bacterium]
MKETIRNREIDLFCDYLLVEKGSSLNTIESYRYDLVDFLGWLKSEYGIEDLSVAERGQIIAYLSHCRGKNMAPKSLSRKLSTLRTFYKYL